MMETMADRYCQQANEIGEHIKPTKYVRDNYIKQIDVVDDCTYYYFTDGSGVVWDDGEKKAHVIDMDEMNRKMN